MIKFMTLSLENLATLLEGDDKVTVLGASRALANLAQVRGPKGELDEGKLLKMFEIMRKSDLVLPLHVSAQNAGIVFTKQGDDVQIEAFEVSPLNEAVISTRCRLRRCFPGPALTVKSEDFMQPESRATVAQTIAMMSHQVVVGARPKVKKAGQLHDEDRDTTSPALVTELLIGFFRPLSSPINIERIWKNTREQVEWLNARLPWRRSPLWLFLRVIVQLLLLRSGSSTSTSGRELYKTFMIFLLIKVLETSMIHGLLLEADFIHIMSAKIAQQMLKLNLSGSEPGIQFTKNVLTRAKHLLQERWEAVMTKEDRPLDLGRLKDLDFEKDSEIALPELDQFIQSVDSREASSNFMDFQPVSNLSTFQPYELPKPLVSSDGDYSLCNLAAFEQWVASNLDVWLEAHQSEELTCQALWETMVSYYEIAHKIYAGNPETISIMLLTILELWIACDKSAGAHISLLYGYKPGIPLELFKYLILPFKDHMVRLLRAEQYINGRTKKAQIGTGYSIFSDFGSPTSFSARYFDQSLKHQKLRRTIEGTANETRLKKIEELAAKKREYEDLMKHYYAKEDCTFVEVWNPRRLRNVTVHSRNCMKCYYLAQANNLKIQVHEWPLPNDTLAAKSVVFELDAPCPFSAWREATSFLLFDVFKLHYDAIRPPRATHSLEGYEALVPYFKSSAEGRNRRLGLLSEDKPHAVTHQESYFVSSVTRDEICLNNGLHYQHFDHSQHYFVGDFSMSRDVLDLCTFELPSSAAPLQPFVSRSFDELDSTPNSVITSQSTAPL